MRSLFLLAVGTVPGLMAGFYVTRFYEHNEISQRKVFRPLSRTDERHLARKVMKVWGERMNLRYKASSNHELINRVNLIYTTLVSKLDYKLPIKLHILDTQDEIIYLLPSGDLFLSHKTIQSLNDNQLATLLAHELAHLSLRHAQEHLGYHQITALFSAWMARHNHHTTERLRSYLLDPSYTPEQEQEAVTSP